MSRQKSEHEAKVKQVAGIEVEEEEQRDRQQEEKSEKSKVLEEQALDAELQSLKSEMDVLYQTVKFITGIDKSVSAVARLLHSSTKTGS